MQSEIIKTSFSKKNEKKIEIDWIEPSEEFESNTQFTTIELQIQTSGGGDYHNCYYSFSGYETMIKIWETGESKLHAQPLERPAGTDKIYVQCEDETGDYVQGSTEYRIIYDTSTPQVARVWQTGSTLYIITTEEAECVYSTDHCNFKWENGTAMGGTEEHTISVIPGKRYHIKCKDEFGNAPSGSEKSSRTSAPSSRMSAGPTRPPVPFPESTTTLRPEKSPKRSSMNLW